MNKVDIAGLKIDAVRKSDLLDNLRARIVSGQKTWLTTPYSEFLHAGLLDPEVMRVLNTADVAVPDGIGLFWAARYLSIPLTAKSYWGKILQSAWQIKYSLAAIIFNPGWIKSAMPEKISGSDLVWDLAKLAADNNFSVYLLGGFGNTAELAAKKLLDKTPQLKTFWSNKNPDDPAIIEDIKKAAPDILLVAFGPIKQECWIAANLQNLPVKLAAGLGGTFDYLAGKKLQPPKFIRRIGLEWLWRLFTQPYRAARIWRATFGLAFRLWHYKVFMNLPYRPNVVSIVLNNNNEVLVALRNPSDKDLRATGDTEVVKLKNYWQFSQGGVDDHERLVETALRELHEELGITNLTFIRTSDQTTSYLWKNARRPFLFNKKFRFRGQHQHIVYFRFTGDDSEIKVDDVEFIDFKWVSIALIIKMIHPEKINVAQIVMAELKEMAEKGII